MSRADDLRALDAEFAERVLGWAGVDAQYKIGMWEYTDPGDPLVDVTRGHGRPPGQNHSTVIPLYHSDLTAAWAGVEKVKSDEVIFKYANGVVECWIYKDGGDHFLGEGSGATPAEALVRACLEAVKK